MRYDGRRGKVLRRLAGDDPEVNEEWNCDKGRWGFQYATAFDRLTTPLVKGADGVLREASWPEALPRPAVGLRAAKDAQAGGVLTAAALTPAAPHASSHCARTGPGTNDADFPPR